MSISVVVTQRIYLRLHSFALYFFSTAFDMHRPKTLAKKHEGTTRQSHDATNTFARCPRGTIKSQVCSFSYTEKVGDDLDLNRPVLSLSDLAAQ